MATVLSAHLKRNLQTYQLLKSNATLTKSLVLRLVLGVLGGLPITSLALFTAFERIGYSFFDIWISSKVKSKHDLFKLGVLGLFLKILADATLLALFFQNSNSTLLAPVFLSVSGSLLGVGQALTQGHIEDFYQIYAKKYLNFITKNSQIQHRQKGLSYWNWWAILNLFSILSLLCFTYFLYYYYKIEFLLLITAAQNALLILKIYFDQKKFSLSENRHAAVATDDNITRVRFSINTEGVFLTLINSISMLLLMSSCYFMFITLCLDKSVKSQFNLWAVILMFILGYEYLGAMLSQWMAPKLIKYYKHNMFFSSVAIVITSLIFLRFHSRNLDFFPSIITYCLFLIYPLIMSFCLKIIGSISLKQIHRGQSVKSKQLAYSTFPGHILLALYCFYLVSNGVGIPDLVTTLNLNLYLSFFILVLVSLYIFYQRGSQKTVHVDTNYIEQNKIQ